MAQTIKLRRSATSGAQPTTSQLELGELALNTYDGKVYMKKSVGGTESIVEVSGGGSGATGTMYTDEFSGDGNTAGFTLSVAPVSEDDLIVFIDGVYQNLNSYSISGTTLTFDTAPDNGTTVIVHHIQGGILGTAPVINTMTGNGVLTTLTLSVAPSSENQTFVTFDGVVQHKDTYSVSGTTLTFSEAVPNGVTVECVTFRNVQVATFEDADGDTKIQVEESADEDIIRFDVAGTEVLQLTSDGLVLSSTDVEANEFIGDLRGAVLFKAQAGENVTKGDVVYISGISGNTTVVSKADADDASKMPAFGIVAATTTSGQPVDIYTQGILGDLDTSSYSEGDELFVSTTAGGLTNTAPTGETALLQKIAKVTRSNALSGSIFITGAGRTNAVPNLDEDQFFLGNASNQAVATDFSDSVESYLDGGTSTPTFASATVSGDLTVDTSTLKVNSSNNRVGIGTAIPDGKLHVESSSSGATVSAGGDELVLESSATTGLSILSGTANGGNILFGDSDNSAIGYMQYLHADNALAFGTNGSEVARFNSSGYFGIGTDSPDRAIKIHQDNAYVWIADAAGGNVGFIGGSGANDGLMRLYEGTGHTAKVEIHSNSDSYFNGGNVGIGTDSPSTKLDVSGFQRNTLGAVFQGSSNLSSGAGLEVGYNSGGSYSFMQSYDRTNSAYKGIRIIASQIDFDIANDVKATIDSSGNVGIGTDSPLSTLHLQAPANSDTTLTITGGVTPSLGSNAIIKLIPDGTSGEGVIDVDGSDGYDQLELRTGGATALTIDGSQNVGIGTTSPSALLHVAGDARIGAAGATSQLMGQVSSGGVFEITTSSSVGKIHLARDVGIGTDSPDSPLHIVTTSTDATINLECTDAGTNTAPELHLYRNSASPADGDNVGNILFLGEDSAGNKTSYAQIYTNIVDVTDGTEDAKLYLKTQSGGSLNNTLVLSSGNVGIGTGSPDKLLHLEANNSGAAQNNTLRFTDTDTATETGQVLGRIEFETADSNNAGVSAYIQAEALDYLANTHLTFGTGTGSASEKMRITQQGKVGIGTTSPATTLDIRTTNGSDAKLRIGSSSSVGNTAVGIFEFYSGDVDDAGVKATIQNEITGNVGPGGLQGGNIVFGTTASGNGTTERLRISSDGSVYYATSGGDGYSFSASGSGPDVANMFCPTSYTLAFGTNGAERMRLTSGGLLTIKSTTVGAGGGQMALQPTNASTADAQDYGFISFRNNSETTLAQIKGISEGSGNNKSHIEFYTSDGSLGHRMRIRDNGTVQVIGALSKGSGSFEIEHPLESKRETHLLRHSFIEGPQCDNIYRGTVTLTDGSATVNLDSVSNMTNGTFVALNTDVQVFTTNETDWDAVKGSVSGNILTITCQNSSSTATVSWLVIAERQDDNIISSTLTDEYGKLIVEPEVYEGGT